MHKKSNKISSYNLLNETTSNIMDFVRRRVTKTNNYKIPKLIPINVFNLNKLFQILERMEPDDYLITTINKAMDEIELLEHRDQFLIKEHEMLYKQLDERDKYGV